MDTDIKVPNVSKHCNYKVLAGSSHPELVQLIRSKLGISSVDNDIQYFSNTEIRPLIKSSVRGCNVYIIQTGSNNNLRSINDYIMELYLLIKTCKRSDAKSINVILPFYPYCRQDKKDFPRGAICARDMADLLEMAGANRVITFRLHNPAIQGFFTIPVDNLFCDSYILSFLKKIIKDKEDDYVLVSPDEGALKMTKLYASGLKLPMVYFCKERDYTKQNVVENSNLIGSKKYIVNKHAIIIDDMCDTFGSLNKAISLLEKKGVKDVIIVVTHGILSGPAIDRINKCQMVKTLLTSDSLPQRKNVQLCDKIKTFTISNQIVEVIRRLESGRSISEMFQKN